LDRRVVKLEENCYVPQVKIAGVWCAVLLETNVLNGLLSSIDTTANLLRMVSGFSWPSEKQALEQLTLYSKYEEYKKKLI